MVSSGGTYGFARVTVGPYLGFLVGAFEAMANIAYTFVGMMPIGTSLTYILNGDPIYEPLYWFLAYVTVIGMEFMGRKVYFKFLNAYAFAIIMIVIFYLILAIQSVDVDTYLPPVKGNLFKNGMSDLMSIWPIVGWFYLGFETMPLISDEIQNVSVAMFHPASSLLTCCIGSSSNSQRNCRYTCIFMLLFICIGNLCLCSISWIP